MSNAISERLAQSEEHNIGYYMESEMQNEHYDYHDDCLGLLRYDSGADFAAQVEKMKQDLANELELELDKLESMHEELLKDLPPDLAVVVNHLSADLTAIEEADDRLRADLRKDAQQYSRRQLVTESAVQHRYSDVASIEGKETEKRSDSKSVIDSDMHMKHHVK